VSDDQVVEPVVARLPRRRHRVPAWVWFGLVVVVVLLAWDGVRAWQIQRSLGRAESDISQLRTDLDASTWSALIPDANRLASDSHAAAAATHDPLWVLTTHLPWVGSNPREVSVVARALSTVARQGAVPLTRSRTLTVVASHDAGLPQLIASFESDRPAIASAVAAVTQANANVQSLHTGDLLPFVRQRVVSSQLKLSRATNEISNVGRLAIAAPPLLGQDRPQTLLLLFQTPAEPRGTGGLVGAWGELRTDKGAVSLVAFGANDDLPNVPTLPAGVNPEIATNFGADIQLHQNFNLSASFPDAAQIFAASWTAGPGNGVHPDAVLSIDPVALGELLTVIGPVDTASGVEINADNAADELLRKEYYTFTSTDQTQRVAFLGDVTKSVFDRVTAKQYAVGALGRALASMAGQRRLLVWSADAVDQQQWDGLGISGALGPPSSTAVRVAVNSLDGSKLGAYLKTSAVVANCGSPGPLVTLTFASEAPAELPDYPSTHVVGLDATTMRLSFSLYLSPAWGVRSVSVAGQPIGFASGTESGWRLIRGVVDVPRASSVVADVQLVGGHGASEVSAISVQPQAIPVVSGITPGAAGGANRCAS